jgi:putative ABC transport system permease protein
MKGRRKLSFASSIRESIPIALASLWANKLRAFLTLLGVVIGVATVIAVVSIIAGMNNYVIGTFSSWGSDNFSVQKMGIVMSIEQFMEKNKRANITIEEKETVAKFCELCDDVGAQLTREGRVKFEREYVDDTFIVGLTANMLRLSRLNVIQGRDLTDTDVDHKTSVTVLGWEIADILFGSIDPIGRKVRITGEEFTVIGVIEKRGTFLGESMDNFVIVPITTFEKLYGKNNSVEIVVRAPSRGMMFATQDEVRTILRSLRGIPFSGEDDFDILTSDMLIDLYKSFTGAAFMVMIGISSISLIVGGIVIMNIMLVSVTERTKEIGIRKAIGARKRDILNQFLVESVTVSLVGGAVGILLGVILAKLVATFSPLPAAIEPWSVIAGIVISSSVGIFFGIFPALRAARLDPIEALRME